MPMKRFTVLFLLISLIFSGCASWMDGQYHSITPHINQSSRAEKEITVVSNYDDIRSALEDMVSSAVESGILSSESYDSKRLESNMARAIQHIKETFPLGAFAVEDISYEIGTFRGMSAVAVTILYNHNRDMLQRIPHVSGTKPARSLINLALSRCDSSLVMYVENYSDMDYLQFVRDYGLQQPAYLMELPQVTVSQYPESGTVRVIELQFIYQNSRTSLQNMQNYVQPVFSSAALYVSNESDENTKFELLYSFLMERHGYSIETSITPAYSLLRHGVGDSKAFASVYAAMCRRANLDCQVIYGTKDGEPWFWNIIKANGGYCHVDLINSYFSDQFQKRGDSQMEGYVWDYSAYPPCIAPTEEANDGT